LKTLTIFRDELTRSDCSKTLEVSRQDCRRFEHWDGDRDEFCVFELGFNAFQLELSGLSESDGKESTGNEEGTESHREWKWGEVEVSERAELSVLPIIFQVITAPPSFNITGDNGDDSAGRTATATLWPRA